MKFITEDDLRDRYKIEPFSAFQIEPETKLTPGARQFLMDLRVNLLEYDQVMKTNSGSKEIKSDWKSMKLKAELNSIDVLFLICIEELLKEDVLAAQGLMSLQKHFSKIRLGLIENTTIEELQGKGCSGMCVDEFMEDLGDCFEITDFHMQLEKGRQILTFHKLRCELRKMVALLLEFVDLGCLDRSLSNKGIMELNKIINTLSQIICLAVGGKTCQRKV